MNIRTWADGFGNWHAVVPLSNDPKSDKQLAQAAILWELNDRGPFSMRATRKMVPVSIVETNVPELTAHYVEVA